MKSFALFALILIGAVTFAVTVEAIVLQPVTLQDVQSNGTNVGYFSKQPLARKWNFKGGATYNTSTHNLDIGGTYGSITLTPTPTPTPSPSQTCTPEGSYYVWAGSATQKTTSFMCCQDGAGHLYWLRGVCQ